MARAQRIHIDASVLQRDCRQLVDRLERGGVQAARNESFITAGRIGAATPYRTGALFNTIAVQSVQGGWGVAWGGDLVYAFYVNKRKRPIQKGMRGARPRFKRALKELADRETARV